MLVTHLLRFALFTLVLSAAGQVRAQEPGTGFEAGLRSGYLLPLGKMTGDSGEDLDQGISGAIPIWVDIGYRVVPQAFVGVYGQYAFGFMGDQLGPVCDASDQVSCSATTIRIGLQAHYHPIPESLANPWVGLGFGYEWLSFGVEGGGNEVTITGHGFEFANLQAGLDFKVTDNFYLGPALSFSLGQYSDVSADCSGAASMACASAPEEIEDKALHEWLMLSVRGAYAP
jgi:hypothetical protein